MTYVTTEEMRRLDETAIRVYGIPSLLLMENAGRGIADLAETIVSKAGKRKQILVIVGKGNNGGDGFVAARHLANRGYAVRVVLLADPRALKDDPKTNFHILKKMRRPIDMLTTKQAFSRLDRVLKTTDLVLDGIFGVGLRRPVSGIFFDAIERLNQSQKPILAIDIPSGLNSDTGHVLGIAVRAKATGTLGCAKRGLVTNEGPRHAGKVTVLDISIPAMVIARMRSE